MGLSFQAEQCEGQRKLRRYFSKHVDEWRAMGRDMSEVAKEEQVIANPQAMVDLNWEQPPSGR